MKLKNIKNKTALVTGASSGLGVDFAEILASKGCNVVLVARRKDRLEELKKRLEDTYKIKAYSIPMDLSEESNRVELFTDIKSMGLNIDFLINNAGYAIYGSEVEILWADEKKMIDLDIHSVVHLTKLFLDDMLNNNFGRILFISSIGAYLPSPFYASYSASKSFVLSYGIALNNELKGTNVKCTVLCPGVTKTEFLHVANQKVSLMQSLTMMKSKQVAKIGINCLLKGKLLKVTGFMNTVMMFTTRFLSKRFSAVLARMFIKN